MHRRRLEHDLVVEQVGQRREVARGDDAVPAVEHGVVRFRAHDAEALPGGRLHDAPRVHLADAPCTERLEPRHLGVDVVALDVQVHAARMVDPLHLDVQAAVGVPELHVLLAFLRGEAMHVHPQRLAPEVRGCGEVVGVAVDDEAREPARVHGASVRLTAVEASEGITADLARRPRGTAQAEK